MNNRIFVLSVFLLVISTSGISNAYKKEAIDVSGINAMDVETSYGYTTVSIKAEVCNNENPAKIFLTIKGKNWNGNELADIMFDSIVLDNGECRTVTETKMIKSNIRSDIRDWEVKSIKRYKP